MRNLYRALAGLLLTVILAGCGGGPTPTLYRPGETIVYPPSLGGDPTISSPVNDTTPASTPAPVTAAPRVELITSQGRLVLELFLREAPVTVDNFLQYVEADFYDNTLFHRVIAGFMIQGGGYTAEMTEKDTREPIVNESSPQVRNLRGTIAMARLPEPDTATAQFFINLVDNEFLDATPGQPGYAVFGRVVEGMEIVDAIARTSTRRQGSFEALPVEPVVIQDANVLAP